MNKSCSYVNGNYYVVMFNDGTKVRHNNEDSFKPQFPESIDLKICNRCNMGCPMCHEQSVPNGELADLDNPLLDSLHPYTELAIGGGNPLEHPGLEAFLMKMRDKNVICNITVHFAHFMENAAQIAIWCKQDLLHGVGVSVNRPLSQTEIDVLKQFPNLVIHTIAGVTTNETFHSLYDNGLKVLILGYKDFGRGVVYGKSHPYLTFSIDDLANNLSELAKHFDIVSFDNLAVEQLGVRNIVTDKEWEMSYMGDDGNFTMYVDLVKKQYALSSVSVRHNITSDNIEDLFANVINEANEFVEVTNG